MVTNDDVYGTPTVAILLNRNWIVITDMAADELPLSDYARELSISNKRRYLEKLFGIQDPYLFHPLN